VGFSVVYPYHVGGLIIAQALFASLVLLIISVVFFIGRGKYPFLLVGWLWFLGVLVPMIGIVQVGSQARADRYTYLAQIGLYLLVTWGALELFTKWHGGRKVLIAVAVLIITGLTADSYIQTSYWRNSETLWTHALANTSDNPLAQSNLGNALMKKGQLDKAVVHFRKALEIYPDYTEANNNLGYVLMKKGQLDDAIVYFRKTLAINAEHTNANYNLAFALGYTLAKKGNMADAITSYRAAMRIQPNDPIVHNNLAAGLMEIGKTDEAIQQFREALRLDGNYQEAHVNLASLLLQFGQRDEAVAHLREALRLKPDDAEVKAQLRQLGLER